MAYGEQLVSSGPIYRAMQTASGQIRVSFDSIGGGLAARGGKLVGFQIAGSDRKFVDADAVIEGGTLALSSPAVAEPVAVRVWLCTIHAADAESIQQGRAAGVAFS